MRPGQTNKRMRGRPNNNRKGPNPLTRSYESSGPDVKIRGTAHHIGEKYLQLARDAQSAGDPVTAESYLQHAEHYFRLIAMAQQAQQQGAGGYQRQPNEADDIEDGDDFIGIPDRFASPTERFASAPQPTFAPPPPQQGGPQPNPERPFYVSPEKQGYERAPRQERSFQDKSYPEKTYQERPYSERPYGERNGSGRDSDSRGQGQRGRPPREYRNDAAPRGESRVPSEELERNGLPAFITAPVRPQPEALGAEPPNEAFPAALVDQPEADRDVGGFHLRPRRRRRSKAEMALDQASGGGQESNASDPVGD
ncbi:DUF4167 domain-containing protein [Methylocapsa acidiphila]|uniref:DUF4167 domain-containing protein n=1 Tax=Methylocapsa acidiphila TaxID=133552 RepID=UPI00040F07B8|nr:DUF4167 domain-containing protein [Methylocapsa acidiphila]